jgi:transcription initiation factor IIE alpha subunit
VQGTADSTHYFDEYEKCVLDSISENGSTPDEISELLNMRIFDVLRALKKLDKKRSIENISQDGRVIYKRV